MRADDMNVDIDGTALLRVRRASPSLWRVTFDNPPINLIDPQMLTDLVALLELAERDEQLAVIVFDSADTDFFLAHWDIAADPRSSRRDPAEPQRASSLAGRTGPD